MGGPDFQLLTDLAGKNTLLDLFGIFSAQYLPYIVVLFFIGAILLQKQMRRKLQLIFFSTFALAVSYGIIGTVIEQVSFRPRPFVQYAFTPLIEHEPDTSFPSSHTIVLFTIATITFFSISRRQGMWLYVMATLVGLGRIFAGLHFPLDIAAGALIGFVSPLLLRLFIPEFKLSPPVKTETEAA